MSFNIYSRNRQCARREVADMDVRVMQYASAKRRRQHEANYYGYNNRPFHY
jgi:hypothetical protein